MGADNIITSPAYMWMPGNIYHGLIEPPPATERHEAKSPSASPAQQSADATHTGLVVVWGVFIALIVVTCFALAVTRGSRP